MRVSVSAVRKVSKTSIIEFPYENGTGCIVFDRLSLMRNPRIWDDMDFIGFLLSMDEDVIVDIACDEDGFGAAVRVIES